MFWLLYLAAAFVIVTLEGRTAENFFPHFPAFLLPCASPAYIPA